MVSSGESAFQRVARELTEFFPDLVAGCPVRAQRQITAILPRLCLDPSVAPAGVAIPGFNDLIGALSRYKVKFESAIAPLVAATQVQGTIFEALDFALEQRGIVLLEGEYRSGKSYSAQAWCLKHLGQARYVQLSSSNDEGAFFRSIARAVGAACNLQMKAAQMRVRIEETIRGQHLLLCIDEADWILGSGLKIRNAPQRLNWLMTAMTNNGTPVALIASKNFGRLLRNIEARCPIWGSEQFHGRLRLRKTLPGSLSQDDLLAIARLMLPGADAATLMLLVGFALESKGRVSALENAVIRGRFFAGRQNRAVAFEDIEEAMRESGYQFPDAAPASAPETDAAILLDGHNPRRGQRTSAPFIATACHRAGVANAPPHSRGLVALEGR